LYRKICVKYNLLIYFKGAVRLCSVDVRWNMNIPAIMNKEDLEGNNLGYLKMLEATAYLSQEKYCHNEIIYCTMLGFFDQF
jgi:hypothetical protein